MALPFSRKILLGAKVIALRAWPAAAALFIIVPTFIALNHQAEISKEAEKAASQQRAAEAQAKAKAAKDAEAALTPTQRQARAKRKVEEDLEREAEARKREVSDSLLTARYACQKFVVQSLHDPDSGDMDDFSNYRAFEKNGIYSVQVTGRARNGFNALRRLTVDCSVMKTGPDKWVAVSLRER